jgi:FG-GAP-like repeat/FG-GAP repeat
MHVRRAHRSSLRGPGSGLLVAAIVLAASITGVLAPSAQATSSRWTSFTPPAAYEGLPIPVGDQRWYCHDGEHFTVTDQSNQLLHTWLAPGATCGGVSDDSQYVSLVHDQTALNVVAAADGSSQTVDFSLTLPSYLEFDGAVLAGTWGDRVLATLPVVSANTRHIVLLGLSDSSVTDLGPISEAAEVSWNPATHRIAENLGRHLFVAHVNDDDSLTTLAERSWNLRMGTPQWSTDGTHLYALNSLESLVTYDPTTLKEIHAVSVKAHLSTNAAVWATPLPSGFVVVYGLLAERGITTTRTFIAVDRTGSRITTVDVVPGGSPSFGRGVMGEGGNLLVVFGSTIGVFLNPGLKDSELSLLMGRPDASGRIVGRGTLTIAGRPAAARTLTLTSTNVGPPATTTLTTNAAGGFSFHRNVSPGWTTYSVTFAATSADSGATISHRTRPRVVPYDFNGDGKADLVVATAFAPIGKDRRAGRVTVLPGSASGVTTTAASILTQATRSSAVGLDHYFGWTTASGDLNGDGYADLVVSAPFHLDPNVPGEVIEFFGSAEGLAASHSAVLKGSENSENWTPGTGAGLAVGDINGDGYDEVMVGEPGSDAVQVYGQHLSAATELIKHIPHPTNARPAPAGWGADLAVGDANGDGFDDLAIGAPVSTDGVGFASGSVTVLTGSAHGWSSRHLFTLNTPGIAGTPTRPSVTWGVDAFGDALAFGDLNGDGRADLIVGAPGIDVQAGGHLQHNAGATYVLRGTSSGVTAVGAQRFTQATPGVPGTALARDDWGGVVATGDVNGDGRAETAIGGLDGFVAVFPGSGHGLSLSGVQAFNENTPGVVGTAGRGSLFGSTFRFGDFRGDGYADLAVGAPGTNDGVGSVTVLPGGPGGLTGLHSQTFTPDTPGVPGVGHPLTFFGWLY